MSQPSSDVNVQGLLQAVPPAPEKMIEVFVNGMATRVPNTANLVEAARLAGEYVPTLCYHPRLQPIGKCGLCCVSVEGTKDPILGCSAHVSPGMRIVTDTQECKAKTALAMSRIVNKIANRKIEDFSDAPELEHVMQHTLGSKMGDASTALQVDMTKCIECTRCVRVCRDVQGLGIWKFNEGAAVPITTSSNMPVSETMCISCGQCSAVCPSGALKEQTKLNVVQDAMRAGKIVVASVAPSVRVAVGEEFGLAPGTISTGKLVMALKRVGIHFVFDTNFTADLTIMEEGTEFANRLISGKGPFPMFTSCCPGWINLVEKQYPELIPHVSTCKSPQGMIGALIKTYFAEKIHKRAEDIFHISIMPCTAKKDEAARSILGRDGYQDIDYVMTTRECAQFLKLNGISGSFDLELPFDSPLGIASGAGAIFGASGGVTEAVLRTAADRVAGSSQLITSEMQAVRGFQGIKTAYVSISGHRLRIAVINGVANVKRFIAEIERVGLDKCGFHFVEIMACPGGCIGGGGQPHSNDGEILKKRSSAIYEIDSKSAIRRSHENPTVMELYKTFLGEPNGHKSHELLHTHYHERKVMAKELAAAPQFSNQAVEGQDAIAVLYASVGGTTEGVARRIYNELKGSKLNAQLWPMDTCIPSDLKSIQTVIILTCTFGDGELPPMTKNVWDWLEEQPAGALKGIQYAVFGLGSSKYNNFNLAAKKFDFKMEGLGASRFVELGLGDECAEDAHNTALDPWLAHLYEELGVEPPKTALVPHYRLVLGFEASYPVPPPAKTMYSKLTASRLVTKPAYNRPIHYMEFDLAETGYEYFVGDALGIHPENAPADILKFLDWYGLRADAVISVMPIDEAAPLPIPPSITVQHLFVRYLDVFSRPKKLFFRQLAQFATNPAEKAKLEALASKDGAQMLTDYLKDGPSHCDVLSDFPSAHPTLDFLVEMLPLIKPRLYSVASCPTYVGSKCQLIIGIPTEVKRGRGKVNGGLSTSWLATLKEGVNVPVLVHEGSLRPPTESTAPILMCGLGTGMAPMRALLQHRLKEKADGKQTGYSLLYQACRYQDGDFILQDELDNAKKQGVLNRHIGAFSHQNKGRFETIDLLMKEHPEEVWEVMKLPEAHYFYCGPAAFNIPTLLENAIINACTVAGKMTKDNATALIEKMKAEKRWRVEAF